MGTAVLLPQDCLPTSKSRHKSHLSEAIFYSDRTSQGRRGTSALRDSSTLCQDHSRKIVSTSRVEWTAKLSSPPLPNHGQDVLLNHGLQKEVEKRRTKVKRLFEVRAESKSVTKSACDAPVVTILQRPKDKEAADELIVKFLVKVEGEKILDGKPGSKLGSGETPNEPGHSSAEKPKLYSSLHSKSSETNQPGAKSGKGGSIMKVEEPRSVDLTFSTPKLAHKMVEIAALGKDLDASKGQFGNVAPDAANPINFARKESYGGFHEVVHLKGLSQVASLKATPEYKNLEKPSSVDSKHMYQGQPAIFERIMPGGLSRLKRATTDPQIVKQVVDRYRSEVVNIPSNEIKSCHGFAKPTSMSCPERWAGPSYYTSPAPSSLPLPKFSLPNQKVSSMGGHTRSMPLLANVESSSPVPSPLPGGALDVAFATESLRRMLKLDSF